MKFGELVGRAFMQKKKKKRNDYNQLFPQPLAIRKEIYVLIRFSFTISPPLTFWPFCKTPPGKIQRVFDIQDFSNPA